MKQQDGIQHIQEEEHDVHYNVIIFNFLRKTYKIECIPKRVRKTSKDEPKDVQTRFYQELQAEGESKGESKGETREVGSRTRTESDIEAIASTRRAEQAARAYTGGTE